MAIHSSEFTSDEEYRKYLGKIKDPSELSGFFVIKPDQKGKPDEIATQWYSGLETFYVAFYKGGSHGQVPEQLTMKMRGLKMFLKKYATIERIEK